MQTKLDYNKQQLDNAISTHRINDWREYKNNRNIKSLKDKLFKLLEQSIKNIKLHKIKRGIN